MAEPKPFDMRILEKAETRRFTLGIVYEPGAVDSQGEFAKSADIEAAAWAFMERLQAMAKAGSALLKGALSADADGIAIDISEITEEMAKGAGLDDQHLQVGDEEDLGIIVESYIAPADMKVGDQEVKKGAWLLGVRWNESMWTRIQKGERTGLSMFGRVTRITNQPVEA